MSASRASNRQSASRKKIECPGREHFCGSGAVGASGPVVMTLSGASSVLLHLNELRWAGQLVSVGKRRKGEGKGTKGREGGRREERKGRGKRRRTGKKKIRRRKKWERRKRRRRRGRR